MRNKLRSSGNETGARLGAGGDSGQPQWPGLVYVSRRKTARCESGEPALTKTFMMGTQKPKESKPKELPWPADERGERGTL